MVLLHNLSAIFGILGFVITVVTLLKVQSVRRAQREERALLRKLYGTEALATHLRSATTFLRQGREDEARVLAEELVRLCGQIEGISHALDTMTRVGGAAQRSLLLVERGYFTPAFLRRAVDEARHNLDFLIYRNLQFANVDLLEAMEHAAKRGVRIRILALSSAADNAVLEQASLVLPWPQAAPAIVSSLPRSPSGPAQPSTAARRAKRSPACCRGEVHRIDTGVQSPVIGQNHGGRIGEVQGG